MEIFMENEKELILKQIQTIQNSVSNRAKVMPDAPAHYFVWAFLSFISIATPYWITTVANFTGLDYALILALELILMLIIGFGLTSMLLQKELDSSGLICVPELRIMRNVYLVTLSFSAILTLILVDAQMYYFISGIWLFALGLSMYVENALSKRFFGNMGIYLVLISFAFLLFCYFSNLPKEELCFIGDSFGFVFISGLLAFLGIKLYSLKNNNV
jgi:hypothetical protein